MNIKILHVIIISPIINIDFFKYAWVFEIRILIIIAIINVVTINV